MEDLRMISYYDGQLTDIMPFHINKEPEVQALSYALQQGTKLLYRYNQRLYLYTKFDEQPEEIVDLLAAELRTQYYQTNMDLDTKRKIVKNTLVWYMTAGTPAAVEELVKAVFGKDGEVKEWWEYGGKPYCFRIKSEIPLTENNMDNFIRIIQKVKNTRSHLEAVEVFRQLFLGIYEGGAVNWSSKKQTIEDSFEDTIIIGQVLNYAASTKSINKLTIKDTFKAISIIEQTFIGAVGTKATNRNMIKEEEQ